MDEQNHPQPIEFIQSSKIFWITAAVVIVTTLIVGSVVYAWQRSNLKSKEQSLPDTSDLCKEINQSCQSYGQGVGGGDNCCEGLKCDGSGSDGTTGKCIENR